jgi:hypothetical protein
VEDGGLQDKIPQGKKVIANCVYGNRTEPDDHAKLLLPNPMDTQELANFKARVWTCHESFNVHLKFFLL